jgi:drug/metabolite transporter (DMT)-like permease
MKFSLLQTGGTMTRKGWLLFLAMSVFWGIPYFFIKIAVRELDPIVVVFARVAVAAVVLLPVAVQQNILRPASKRWYVITLLSLIQIVGPFLFISYGEQHIASSLTSLLIAAEPLLVALLALRFDKSEKVSRLRLVGLLIGMGGVVILLGLDVGGDGQKLLGTVLVLLAATGYAAGALFVKQPAVTSLPRLGVVTTECALATVLLAPLAVTRLPDKVPSLEIVASLLILGLVCTALAWLTFFALVAEVGAGRGTVFTYVNPAISVLLGVALLHEALNVAIIAGFLLILVGSWLSTTGTLSPVRRLFWTYLQHPQPDASTVRRDDS